MAMACLGLVTFLPLRPDFNLPFFISRISLSTFLPAEGEYLRPEDFLELDFFDEELRVLFAALLPREERLELLRVRVPERPFLELLPDFFLVAFLVAITILLGGQMARSVRQVAYRPARGSVAGERECCALRSLPGTRQCRDRSDNPPDSRSAHQRIREEPRCHAGE